MRRKLYWYFSDAALEDLICQKMQSFLHAEGKRSLAYYPQAILPLG